MNKRMFPCLAWRMGAGLPRVFARAGAIWAAALGCLLVVGCTVIPLDMPGWPPAGAQGATADAQQQDARQGTGTVNLDATWAGHYEGVAPCPDCAGVRILLTLNADNSYTLSMSHMGSNRQPQVIHGRFGWSSDKTEITLDEKGERRRYAVSWSELRMLQHDGSPMLGVLGEQLTLKKRSQ